MKTNPTRIHFFAFGFIALAMSFFGATESARAESLALDLRETVNTTVSTTTEAVTARTLACAKIDSQGTALRELISVGEARYENAKVTRSQTLAENRAESDRVLAQARADADANYKRQYENLMKSADNKAEKKAVTAFESEVVLALSVRRKAVDTAIKTYRDGVDAIIANREGSYAGALEALKTAIDNRLASKKSNCMEAQVPASALSIKNELETSRAQFRSKLPRIDTATANLEILATKRDESISKAEADFQTRIALSGAALKAAFTEE